MVAGLLVVVCLALAGAEQQKVLIAGGGIAGLYSGHELTKRQNNAEVHIIEASDRWGGRIYTTRLTPTNIAGKFSQEWGPMRFELQQQPLLVRLLADLQIPVKQFVGPSSGHIVYPKYNLLPMEQEVYDATESLGLLKWGLVQLFVRGDKDICGADGKNKVPWLNCSDLEMVRAFARPDIEPCPFNYRSNNAPEHQLCTNSCAQCWLDDVTQEKELELLNTSFPKLLNEEIGLWETGLWNALEIVLSHQAVMLIRDVGTFYSMLPQNLNAAEWGIWWLRAMHTSGLELHTLARGSIDLVDKIMLKLKENKNIHFHLNCKLVDLQQKGNGKPTVKFQGKGCPTDKNYDHVILGLHKAGLQELNLQDKEIHKDVEGAVPFPMVKLHFVVRDPWWTYKTPPQSFANYIPTREVHYARIGMQDYRYDHHELERESPWTHCNCTNTTPEECECGLPYNDDTVPPMIPDKCLDKTDCKTCSHKDKGQCRHSPMCQWDNVDHKCLPPTGYEGFELITQECTAIPTEGKCLTHSPESPCLWQQQKDGTGKCYRRSLVQECADVGQILIYTDLPSHQYWQPLSSDPTLQRDPEIYQHFNTKDDKRIDNPSVNAAGQTPPDSSLRPVDSNIALRLRFQYVKYMVAEINRACGNDPDTALHLDERTLCPDGNKSEQEQMIELDKRIVYFGIRDWQIAPYEGACHGWKIGMKSQEVIPKFTAFNLNGKSQESPDPAGRIHICGEAYSDYQGFIEGALRTCIKVVDSVAPKSCPNK